MKPLHLLSLGLLLLIGAAGCSKPPPPAQPLAEPTYFEADNPKSLREWGMVQTSDGALVLGARVTPYDLTTPLFTDYAQKLRTIWMPPGVSAGYTPDDALSFPVGTVITKTFFYPTGAKGRVLQQADPRQFHDGDGLKLKQVRMIETRLLIRRPEGWTALTYLWNEAQTDAVLHRVGAAVPLTMTGSDGKDETFSYIVPNATQCSACHATNVATREIQPIGPKARLLNRDFAYSDRTENQLSRLTAMGYLKGVADPGQAPLQVSWTDAAASTEARARAYLDVNCGHCHNPKGAAATSGLYLDAPSPLSGSAGLCKPPVAAGAGTGNLRFDIVPGKADESIMAYRMDSTHPAVMMPEIGRSTRHDEGVALIRSWIDSLEGSCR
ncbi:SO2930 family diheme c-type cytochrome [Brevundimonas sanguinis]|uniref:SO2930 family diheme c-type cytochrome n=1 Tax=Brevundimonas sanguinis TaxID=3021811 RepID=UPI002414E883|nr:SO2930 family diheme c-type cytochrome [Brevundimonas sp. NCCP 15609]